MTYVVEFKFPSKDGMQTSFYAEAGFLAGSPMGVDLSFGTYLGGFNVELAAIFASPQGLKIGKMFCEVMKKN